MGATTSAERAAQGPDRAALGGRHLQGRHLVDAPLGVDHQSEHTTVTATIAKAGPAPVRIGTG